ncbi:polysaccharide biosynthesis protein [Gammaproteobacteria bacterium]|nr:polysaccharide biosynthesis protein [Gammaproteobacteria bacterium]
MPNSNQQNTESKTNIYIYGAGGAGKELYDLLIASERYRCVAFIDDNADKQQGNFYSVEVLSPKSALSRLIADEVQEIWLAMANIDYRRAQKIAKTFQGKNVEVKSIPGFSSMLLNRDDAFVDDVPLRKVIGRDYDGPNRDSFISLIHKQSILVTGAGGSIGSELCRIVVEAAPKSIVLVEMSEIALFNIEKELLAICEDKGIVVNIVPILGSATDPHLLTDLLNFHKTSMLFHAAAYKHVRLVELNILKGIQNNILSTKSVIEAAKNSDVKQCVLVSSDKAVRPTNVMGATKRFSELLFQDAASTSNDCVFSSVRFGNVLGSSGSVIPIFKRQIMAGGPVTVTHPDVTRYFMSIDEAAGLIVSAAAMAKGGEVFVLDMGTPIKIVDLAKKLIYLLGNSNNPDDFNYIPLKFIGMAKGEKLHEELVISGKRQDTKNPKIFKVIEPSFTSNELAAALTNLLQAIKISDQKMAYNVLLNHFPSLKKTH